MSGERTAPWTMSRAVTPEYSNAPIHKSVMHDNETAQDSPERRMERDACSTAKSVKCDNAAKYCQNKSKVNVTIPLNVLNQR